MNASLNKSSARFIPYYIAAFFIALMGLMVWFVMLAIHNYPGEVTTDAYKKGLNYNQTIEKSDAQEKLGWKTGLDFQVKGLEVKTSFTLADKNGKPITDGQINAWFIRPAIAGHDKEIPLTPNGKGSYSAKTELALPGEWEVHISATSKGQNYQQVKNINLQ